MALPLLEDVEECQVIRLVHLELLARRVRLLGRLDHLVLHRAFLYNVRCVDRNVMNVYALTPRVIGSGLASREVNIGKHTYRLLL